jgi:hypothetical protein
MTGTAISYGGNSLQTTNITTNTINHEGIGTKLAIPYVLAHANGSVIPYSEFNSKTITLQGTINGFGNIVTTDQLLDTFRGYFALDGQNLDIGYAGGTRRYICTVEDIQIERPTGLAYATFTVTLTALLGFGQDITSTNLVSGTSRTAASYTDSVTIPGSAPWQLPIATINLTAVSATGIQTMTFGNNNNGQAVTISRSGWTAGDVVQFDSTQRQVTVNGAPIDFSGGFPELPPGSGSLAYSDSFTSRTFNYSVAQYTRWL